MAVITYFFILSVVLLLKEDRNCFLVAACSFKVVWSVCRCFVLQNASSPIPCRCVVYVLAHACSKWTWLLWPADDPPSLQTWPCPRVCGTVCVRDRWGSLAAAPHSGRSAEGGGRLKWSAMNYELLSVELYFRALCPSVSMHSPASQALFSPRDVVIIIVTKGDVWCNNSNWSWGCGLRHSGIFHLNHRLRAVCYCWLVRLFFIIASSPHQLITL